MTFKNDMQKNSDQLDLATLDLKRFSKRLNEALDDMNAPQKGCGRQTYLARLLGCSQPTVGRWLEGIGWPNKAEWPGIAATVNCRIEWLFFNLGPKNTIAAPMYDRQIMSAAMSSVSTIIIKYNLDDRENLQADLALSLFEELMKILPQSE